MACTSWRNFNTVEEPLLSNDNLQWPTSANAPNSKDTRNNSFVWQGTFKQRSQEQQVIESSSLVGHHWLISPSVFHDEGAASELTVTQSMLFCWPSHQLGLRGLHVPLGAKHRSPQHVLCVCVCVSVAAVEAVIPAAAVGAAAERTAAAAVWAFPLPCQRPPLPPPSQVT